MQHTECFLSFYPDIYIIFLQHLYIENLNPHNILKLLTIPSLSAKGEAGGEGLLGPLDCPHGILVSKPLGMAVVCPL